jgi:broad specificity phosphatase PhoE
MRVAMADAARTARGHEAVLVSHQLPIWVARREAEDRPLWHHPGRRRCALASVTSFTYHGDTIDAISYAEPAGAGRPQVPGA